MSSSIKIGIIGDYDMERLLHKATNEALNGIQFARENNYLFIGTCGGFQHTVIEYAQNKLGLKHGQHAEFDPYASNLFITLYPVLWWVQTKKVKREYLSYPWEMHL